MMKWEPAFTVVPLDDLGQVEPVQAPLSPELLADMTMEKVKEFFRKETQHKPSQDMLTALRDIPLTVGRIVTGTAKPKYYLSPIDTGVGKSVSLAHTIKCLRDPATPWHDLDVGTVICLGRYSQIEDMRDRMGLAKDAYACYVADARKENNWGLGKARVNDAPILLTTHAMIERRIRGRQWAECEEFFYKGKPRQLRVWDETLLPGVPVMVPRKKLYLLLGNDVGSPEFQGEIEDFSSKLRKLKNGTVLDVPDFKDRYDSQVIKGAVATKVRDDLTDLVDDLWAISGRAAVVVNDGGPGANTLVQYELHLPEDMRPMLILDASARVKETYKLQAELQRNVEQLTISDKRYDRVTLHVKDGPSGKLAFQGKKYGERINEIANLIRRHPDNKILVIHHKGEGNVPDDINRALYRPRISKTKPALVFDVKFCSWGQHNATNDYADCDVVIVGSTLYYRNSVYLARTGISAGRSVITAPPAEQVTRIRRGEVLSELLQGISRGSLRNLDGKQAHPCRVYLSISSRDKSIVRSLPNLFPGATVLNGWEADAEPRTINSNTTEQKERALVYLQDRFSAGATEIRYREVWRHLGMKAGNFSSKVVHNNWFQAQIAALGIEIDKAANHSGRGRPPKAFRKGVK